MARDQKDHYYRKAKEEGYRARSAYKLLQINEKFHVCLLYTSPSPRDS